MNVYRSSTHQTNVYCKQLIETNSDKAKNDDDDKREKTIKKIEFEMRSITTAPLTYT